MSRSGKFWLGIAAIALTLWSLAQFSYTTDHGHAKKIRTKALIYDLVNGARAFYLEYERLPILSSIHEWPGSFRPDQADSLFPLDGSPLSVAFLQTMIGDEVTIDGSRIDNPRETAFFKPDLSNGKSIGLVFDGDTPTHLLDAWGQPIWIALDTDGDDRIADPSGSGLLKRQVIAWSKGDPAKEDEDEPWENNVMSWDY